MADEVPGPPGGSRPPMPRWVKVFIAAGAVIVVLAVLMLSGVLGKGHGPGRHLGMHRGPEAGGPAAAASATRTIELTAKDTAFEPDGLQVSAAEVVTFSITNAGKAVHEFTLGDEGMQREHARMMQHIPSGMGHDTGNSVTIKPGETETLTWRFGDAAMVEFACHQPGHYEAGMRGRITVA